MGPVGIAMIVISLTFLGAGIAWPNAAGALLRVLLATLAVAFVAVRAHGAMLSVRTREKTYSPFDGASAAHLPLLAPEPLRALAIELGSADDARHSQRTGIPWSVRQTVIEEAARRLVEHHGLDLGDTRHHARIRSLVSTRIWLLIDPRDADAESRVRPDAESRVRPDAESRARPDAGSRARPVASTAVPVSELATILDDLENL